MTLSSIKIRNRRSFFPRLALLLHAENDQGRHQREDRRRRRSQQERPSLQVKVAADNQGQSNHQNVDDGKWDQEMPSQPHQLIEAVARYRKSQPHEKIKIRTHLENEPEASVNP